MLVFQEMRVVFAKRNTTKQLHNRKLDHFSTDFMIFYYLFFAYKKIQQHKKEGEKLYFFMFYGTGVLYLHVCRLI